MDRPKSRQAQDHSGGRNGRPTAKIHHNHDTPTGRPPSIPPLDDERKAYIDPLTTDRGGCYQIRMHLRSSRRDETEKIETLVAVLGAAVRQVEFDYRRSLNVHCDEVLIIDRRNDPGGVRNPDDSSICVNR